jgi:hypothetical protein
VALKAWIRGVIADTGEEDPVPVALERAGGAYAFRLGLRAGFGGQETARIPVIRRPNPNRHPILKEIYSCEVAGTQLEAANVHALRARVAAQLDSLAPARTLPLVWFGVPRAAYELPAYEYGGEIVCPILGGSKLRARDLGEMRAMVCRHLVGTGYVDDDDEVTVGVLQPRDLRRVPPAAIFRCEDDPELWIPAVGGVSDDGPVVGLLDHAVAIGGRRRAARREEVAVAGDVLALLRVLRGEWSRARGLEDPRGLYAEWVNQEAWAAAEAHTRAEPTRLLGRLRDADPLELDVRRTAAGDLATAIEDRGITILLGADAAELAAVVGRRLAAGGHLHRAQDVEIAVATPSRPDRLDPGAISQQEAHAWSSL